MQSAEFQVCSSYSWAVALGVLPIDALLDLQAHHPARYPVLLDSAAASQQGGDEYLPRRHDYDVLMAFPGDRLELRSDGLRGPDTLTQANSFLSALDQWFATLRASTVNGHRELPFSGGWFVYLSYELAAEIEPLLDLPVKPDSLIAQAVRIPCGIVRDAVTGEAWFVAEQGSEALLATVREDLARPALLLTASQSNIELDEDAPEQFVAAVHAALEHIAAGDIYQANLSRGWRATLPPQCSPAQLYRRLRQANPAPYAGMAWLDSDHAILSSSPERLIELRRGWANTRPIAGTRPRVSDALSDQALVTELRMHPKERAEHIMLLDLERNDLGRICIGGSVAVNEYMSIESYAHVHHIVSNVRGRLREEVLPGAAIAAVFPGGTITGCPKFRCMQIIAELERMPRSAYTGSMGYLNRDGSMDLNILIRTLEIQGRTLNFRAGAGIVADSIASRELDETRAKALGMLRALIDAGGG